MLSPRAVRLLLLAAWAVLAGRFYSVCDDAYISFRYARNLVEGHGLVYNLEGPPVEGFSNPLWTLLSAVFVAQPEAVTLVSLACGAALVWRVSGRSPWAGAMLALSPAIGAWSSSGLETMPVALAAFLAWEGLEEDRPSAGPALLVLALLRSEGLAWAGLLLAMRFRPRAALWLLPALVVVGLRWAYYGEHVANTARVKVGLRPDALFRGLKYVAWNALALWTPLLALGGLRRDRTSLFVLAVLAYCVVVGGDFMPFGRLLVIGLPVMALLFARLPTPLRTLGLGLGLLPAFGLQHTLPALHFRMPDQAPYTELEAWERERDQVQVLLEVGRMLNGRGHSLSAGAIGAVGWSSELPVIYDRYGLVTPEVAARDVETLLMPGHDKRVGPFYFAKERPTFLFAAFVSREAAPSYEADLRAHGLDSDYEAGFLVEGDRELFVFRSKAGTGYVR